MLKKEPKLLYYYEYIKVDKDRIKKEAFKNSAQKVVDQYYITQIICTDDADMNEKFYKFLYNYREAFVGNMQEDFDEAYGHNNMEAYAKTGGSHIEYKDKIVYKYIEMTVLYYFWKRVKKYFMKIKTYIIEKKLFKHSLKKEQKLRLTDKYLKDLYLRMQNNNNEQF